MASTSVPSALNHYRPYVLGLTGLAALYGTYVLYTTLDRQGLANTATGKLRRRNAIHRQRSVTLVQLPASVVISAFGHVDNILEEPGSLCRNNDGK